MFCSKVRFKNDKYNGRYKSLVWKIYYIFKLNSGKHLVKAYSSPLKMTYLHLNPKSPFTLGVIPYEFVKLRKMISSIIYYTKIVEVHKKLKDIIRVS